MASKGPVIQGAEDVAAREVFHQVAGRRLVRQFPQGPLQDAGGDPRLTQPVISQRSSDDSILEVFCIALYAFPGLNLCAGVL